MVIFMTLFVYLVIVSSAGLIAGYPVDLFFGFDPLIAISTALATHSWSTHFLWAVPLIVLTLIFGRFFCSWMCPMGITHHILGWISSRFKKLPQRAEDNRHRPIMQIKYIILVVMLAIAAMGSSQIGLLDPIAHMWRGLSTALFPAVANVGETSYTGGRHFHFGVLISVLFFGALALNFIFPRFYCRVLCPLGALLGFLSRFSLFRIARDPSKCSPCDMCNSDCHGAANPAGTCHTAECMVCLNCVDRCPTGAMSYSFMPQQQLVTINLDLSRRKVMAGAVAGLVSVPLARASAGAEPDANPKRIRPPGSLAEPEFLERCISCSACMKVCPTGGLQPALTEAGFEGIWTPILVPQIGYCEQGCNLCGEVCPTDAIRKFSIKEKIGNMEKGEEPIRIGSARYDKGRCLPWANDVDCIVCEEVCPTSPKAIYFKIKTITTRDGSTRDIKLPHIDLAHCTGCGTCEARCPVDDKAAVYVTSVGESRSAKNKLFLTKAPPPTKST
jgi:polyferredoxin